jgi:hypothetical protein
MRPYGVAVGDVGDDEVRHVDAEVGDGCLQLRGSSHQEPDGVSGIGNGLGGPAADKSRTPGDKNAHDAIA